MLSVKALGVDCAVFVSVVVLSFLAVPSLLSAQAKDALLGTWRLVSVSSSTHNGKVDNEVYGLHPKGLITYTADGRMSAIITNDGRKPLSVNDRLAAPSEERAQAFSTLVAYAGTYTFTGDKVIHHVEIDALPNRVGSDQVRFVTLQGDRLTLKTPPISRGGEQQVLELVWERLKADAPRAAQTAIATREELIARAKTFELNTPYVPPPGDALAHHTAGFAKIMCSAVFITGLDPDFAAENVGYFTSPYPERAKVGKPVIDRANKTVSIALSNGVTRTAKYLGDQGCVTLPIGETQVHFTPVKLKSRLPDASKQPWPMGDVLPKDALPPQVDSAKLQQAVDAAFASPAEMTAAFVVTWKGRLIAERYGPGITAQTPLEGWSMGKSLTATLMGILIKQGVYDLWQPAPIPEWQSADDPRAKIRIADILHMSSGLRIKAPQDPDYDPNGTYPDHLYLYTGSVDSFHYAATRPLQWPPNTVGRYHNTDPVLTNYLIRLAVEKRKEEYLSFPRRALFDKIGIRTMVLETDPFGNFLTQGYELACGRDWARLGNLYRQDGVWNGEQILPEGYVKFVSTLAPAWEADRRPIYGGFFWINGDGRYPVPKDSFFMSGAGGQTTLIIPSHDLVVVRMGHFKGSEAGDKSFKQALALLMEAIPRNK
jgi:CubicO group peptidase (beta-lactamase class C family)